MFTNKPWLGALSFAITLMAGNLSGVIAQNLRSDRHLSDQEIQSLISKFSPDNPEAIGRIGYYGDRRREYEIAHLNRFVNAWQKVDPSISPFLGYWIGYEDGLQFYPSTTTGQICVVLRYNAGRQGIQKLLNVGRISGDKLITDGDLGKRIFVRKKRKLQQQNNSASSIREVEYVGMFTSIGGRNSFTTYALPLPIPLENDTRLEKFGCVNDLPIEEIGRLSSGERILSVPKNYMSQTIFREALNRPIRPTPNMRYTRDGEPIMYYSDQSRLFLFDGKRYKFVGYDIDSIFEFKVGNQIYWATLCAYGSLSCSGILVSEPNFVNARIVKGFDNNLSVLNIKKDNTQEGWFYAETTNGNGRGAATINYLVNLNLTLADPNQNSVVCLISKYPRFSSGRGNETRINNPDCQTSKQVSFRHTTIPTPSKTPSESV